MRTLSLRERRLVALLILVGLLALLIGGIVMPLVDGFQNRAQRREQLRTELLLGERLIASVPRLRRAAEASDDAVRTFVIAGLSIEAASEQLQDRVSAAIEQAGGDVRSLEDASDGGIIRTRVTASATLPQFVALITQLQDQQPYAAISSLTLTADQALISGRPDIMDVSFDVSVPYAARR